MVRLEPQEVRDALAEVGITGPVAVKLTDLLNTVIEQKIAREVDDAVRELREADHDEPDRRT